MTVYEELVGRLAIHEATAEVVSCLSVIIPTAAVSLRDMEAVSIMIIEIASVGIEYSTRDIYSHEHLVVCKCT